MVLCVCVCTRVRAWWCARRNSPIVAILNKCLDLCLCVLMSWFVSLSMTSKHSKWRYSNVSKIEKNKHCHKVDTTKQDHHRVVISLSQPCDNLAVFIWAGTVAIWDAVVWICKKKAAMFLQHEQWLDCRICSQEFCVYSLDTSCFMDSIQWTMVDGKCGSIIQIQTMFIPGPFASHDQCGACSGSPQIQH